MKEGMEGGQGWEAGVGTDISFCQKLLVVVGKGRFTVVLIDKYSEVVFLFLHRQCIQKRRNTQRSSLNSLKKRMQ